MLAHISMVLPRNVWRYQRRNESDREAKNSLQNSIQAINETGSWVRQASLSLDWAKSRVIAAVSVKRMAFDTGIHERENDGDTHADCRSDRHHRDVFESPGQRDHDYTVCQCLTLLGRVFPRIEWQNVSDEAIGRDGTRTSDDSGNRLECNGT